MQVINKLLSCAFVKVGWFSVYVYIGKSWTTKVAELRDEIVRANAQAMIVTALDEIAWLLNLRARDIPYSPYVRSYLIVNMHNILFFVNDTQLIYNNIIKHFSDTFEEPKNNVR